MANPSFYTTGGTVQAGGGIYLTRKADDDLLQLCLDSTFAYVLTSRQLGKSSLMVRAVVQLREQGFRPVIIDLNRIGVQVDEKAWYLGLLTIIEDELQLKTDVITWWNANGHKSSAQRFTRFFEEILINEVKEKITIFIDEIDSTLSLPFSDDFYAAIRYLYNARAAIPGLKRLNFVLIGVATPTDLIENPKRTPFNIGQRVELTDFTFEEALPLTDGFGFHADEARQTLQWVLKWTGGHPYLTQRLCRSISEYNKGEACTEDDVDRIVADTFFGKMGEQDNNLQFVRDMLIRRTPDLLGVLTIYKDICISRHPVRDEEQSINKNHLKLSGIVRRENGALYVRNPIYRQVFDRQWLKSNWPQGWFANVPAYAKAGAISIVMLLTALIVFLGIAIDGQRQIADRERQLAVERLQSSKKAFADAAENFRLAVRADSLREQAEARQKEAEQANLFARDLAVELLTENIAKTAALDVADSSKARALAEKNIADSLRIITLAQALAIQSPRMQDQHKQDELSVLLARQAFLFNRDKHGTALGQIDETLRAVLNTRYFSTILNSYPAEVTSIVFSADGRSLVSGGADGRVQILDLHQRGAKPAFFHQSSTDIISIATGPNDNKIAYGTVRLWDIEKQESIVHNDHRGPVNAVVFSPDGRKFATVSADSTVLEWRFDGEKITHTATLMLSDQGLSVDYSPDSKLLVSASRDGQLRLWDENVKSVTLPGSQGKILSVAFSTDGKYVASSGEDGTVLLWNLRRRDDAPDRLPGHGDEVTDIAFSPDGKILASASQDTTIRLWDLSQSKSYLAPLQGHDDGVRTVAFSPDGNTVASGSDDGSIRLWNLYREDADTLVLRGHQASVRSVVFRPDGRFLASASDDHTVMLWNVFKPGEEPIVLRGHRERVWSVVFSPDGKMLASAGADRQVRLWNWRQSGTSSRGLQRHESWIRAIAYSPDGKWLASGSDDGSIRIWDTGETTPPFRVLGKVRSGITSVVFSPDSRKLISGQADGSLYTWDLLQSNGSQKVFYGHIGRVNAIAFSPDGRTLATASGDKTVKVWDYTQPDNEPYVLRGHKEWVWAVAFSPDGKTLVSGSADQAVLVRNLESISDEKLTLDSTPLLLHGSQASIHSIALHPDGFTLATGHEDRVVRLWNLHQAGIGPTIVSGQYSRILSVAFSPDGSILAAGCDDHKIRLWDVDKTESEPNLLAGNGDKVWALVFSPDGRTLASAGADSTVRLWNIREPGSQSLVLRGHKSPVKSVAFSPDGKKIVSSGEDGTIRLWDVGNLKAPPRVLLGGTGAVSAINSIVMSPNGAMLAAGSDDRIVRLWNLHDLDAEPEALVGHLGIVNAVVFTADGKSLASASRDRTVRIWDLNQLDATPIVLRGHQGEVKSLAFSNDGQMLISAGSDGTVRLWIARTERLADLACRKIWRNLTYKEWQKYIGPGIPYEATCPDLPPANDVSIDVSVMTNK